VNRKTHTCTQAQTRGHMDGRTARKHNASGTYRYRRHKSFESCESM